MIQYLSNIHEHDRKEEDSSLGRGRLKENENYDVRNDGHPHLCVKESRTSNVKVGECSEEIKSIEPGNENCSKTLPATSESKESLENFCNILKTINTTSSTAASNKRVHLLRGANVDKHDTGKRAIYSRLENAKQKRPVQCCHFQRMMFRVTRTKDRRTFFLPAIIKWEQTSNDLIYNCPRRRSIREHSRQEIVILDSRREDNSNNNNNNNHSNNNNHGNNNKDETCCCTNTKTHQGTETLTGYLVLYDEKQGSDCKGSKKKSHSSKCTCDNCSCCCCCCCCCCSSDDGSTSCCRECCCKSKKKAKRKSKSDGCCVPQCCMPMCCCMCPCMCNGKSGQSGEHNGKPKQETCAILRNGDSNKNKVCEEFKVIRPIPSSFLNTCYIIDDCQCSKDDKPTKAHKPVQTKTTKGTTTKTSTKGAPAKAGAKKPGAKKGAPAKPGHAKKAPGKKRIRNIRSLF